MIKTVPVPERVVFLFIDGLGIGRSDSTNPVHAVGARYLCQYQGEELKPLPCGGMARALDACFGVEGLPQSATGQTALLGGWDAPRLLGHHLFGFPNRKLRQLLYQDNLLSGFKARGAVFANAYSLSAFVEGRVSLHSDGNLECDDPAAHKILRRVSVTTACVLASGGRFRDLEDLRSGRAVYHDYTNETLLHRGYSVPLYTPREAGAHLAQLAKEQTLTLHEYFKTDHVGHDADVDAGCRQIMKIEEFLDGLLENLDLNRTLVVLCSDHGNIEDATHGSHTINKVPLITWGRGQDYFDQVRNLSDVYPCLKEMFGLTQTGSASENCSLTLDDTSIE